VSRLARIICSLTAVAVVLSLATVLGATGGAAGSAVKSQGAAAPVASKAGKPGPRGPRGLRGPAGPAGPAGPSDAYVRGFPNDRFTLPNGASFAKLAQVSIPKAGKYVIWAKAYVTGSNAVVTCQLVAGSDVDQSMVSAAAGAAGSNGYPGTISNLTAHQYDSPGVADFQCALNNGVASVNGVQVAAVRVGNLTQIEGQVP
jgi:hypothetical protein